MCLVWPHNEAAYRTNDSDSDTAIHQSCRVTHDKAACWTNDSDSDTAIHQSCRVTHDKAACRTNDSDSDTAIHQSCRVTHDKAVCRTNDSDTSIHQSCRVTHDKAACRTNDSDSDTAIHQSCCVPRFGGAPDQGADGVSEGPRESESGGPVWTPDNGVGWGFHSGLCHWLPEHVDLQEGVRGGRCRCRPQKVQSGQAVKRALRAWRRVKPDTCYLKRTCSSLLFSFAVLYQNCVRDILNQSSLLVFCFVLFCFVLFCCCCFFVFLSVLLLYRGSLLLL